MRTILTGGSRLVLEMIRIAWKRRSLREILFFLASAAVSMAVAAAVYVGLRQAGVSEELLVSENGPFESLQAYALGLAGILFAVAALRFRAELFYGALGMAFVSGLAVVREIPSCESPFFEGGTCLAGNSKIWIVAALCALGVAALILKREPLARHLRDLTFFWIVPSFFAGILLLAADAMEGRHNVMLEETLELGSYLTLVAFSVALNLKPAQFKPIPSSER